MHTETATITPARQKLRDHVAAGTTADLVFSLLSLDSGPATDTTRTAAAEVVEELVRRFPDTIEALDAWCLDVEGTLSLAEALVAAIPAGSIR